MTVSVSQICQRFAVVVAEFSEWTRKADNTEDAASTDWTPSQKWGIWPHDSELCLHHRCYIVLPYTFFQFNILCVIIANDFSTACVCYKL